MEVFGSIAENLAWSLAALFLVWCLKLEASLGKMNRKIKELEDRVNAAGRLKGQE